MIMIVPQILNSLFPVFMEFTSIVMIFVIIEIVIFYIQ